MTTCNNRREACGKLTTAGITNITNTIKTKQYKHENKRETKNTNYHANL